jgi:microcompartment protein CcmK/EutM
VILARVTGSVHATIRNPHLEDQRLLVVRPLDLAGSPTGRPLICLDRVDAGVGDLVLVNKEGSGARDLLDDQLTPVQAVIVGVVDDVQLAEDVP